MMNILKMYFEYYDALERLRYVAYSMKSKVMNLVATEEITKYLQQLYEGLFASSYYNLCLSTKKCYKVLNILYI